MDFHLHSYLSVRRVVQVCAACAGLLAAFNLAVHPLPGLSGGSLIWMAFGTSASILCLSAALVLLQSVRFQKSAGLASAGVAALVLVYNTVVLARAGFTDPVRHGVPLTGGTAFSEGACALAAVLVLVHSLKLPTTRSLRGLSAILAGGVGMAGVVVLLSYAGDRTLFAPGRFFPMPVWGAAALSFLGLGLCLSAGEDTWLVRLTTSSDAAPRLMRLFLPLTVGVVACHEWMDRNIPNLLGNEWGRFPLSAFLYLCVVIAWILSATRGIGRSLDRSSAGLRDSEERFRALYEQSQVAIAMLNLTDGGFIRSNPAFCQLTGYTPEDLAKLHMRDVTHPEDAEAEQPAASGQPSAGFKEYSVERRIVAKQGEVIWTQVTNSIARDPQGNPAYRIMTVLDIQERKRSEAKQATLLTERDVAVHRWQLQFDKMPLGCVVTDPDLTIRAWNLAAERVFGFSCLEMVGRQPYGLILPEGSRHLGEEFSGKLVGEHESSTGVRENLARDGRKLMCEWHDQILRDESNRIIGILAIAQDVTERQRAQETMCRTLEEYQAILGTTTDGFWVTSRAGVLLEVNDAACRLSGYRRLEMLGMSLNELDVGAIPEALPQHLERLVMQRTDCFHTQHRRKDGIVVEIEANVTYVPTTERFFWFLRDVTERKRAEEALRESSEFNRQVIACAEEGVIVLDVNLRFVVWNPSMENLSGLGQEGVMGKTMAEILPRCEELGLLRAARRALEGEPSVLREVTLQFSRSGQGGYITVTHAPLRNVKGGIIGVIATFRDMSERRWAEEQVGRRQSELEAIYNHAPFMMCLVDRELRVRQANQALLDFLGCLSDQAEGVLQRPRAAWATAGEDPEALNQVILETLHQGRSHVRLRLRALLRLSAGSTPSSLLVSTSHLVVDREPMVLLCLEDLTDREFPQA